MHLPLLVHPGWGWERRFRPGFGLNSNPYLTDRVSAGYRYRISADPAYRRSDLQEWATHPLFVSAFLLQNQGLGMGNRLASVLLCQVPPFPRHLSFAPDFPSF